MEKGSKVRCQRIGCDAMFTEDQNTEDSCTYHASPIFHDGTKEWSCCKQRSHDFSLFLALPGCKTGKHSTEKPVIVKAAPKKPVPFVAAASTTSSKLDCSRCRQDFFCSEHGSQAKANTKSMATSPMLPKCSTDVQEITPPPARKIVNINEPQTCRNKGCGRTFKEKDNSDNACNYHPGPAVFHDRMRGWKCCNVHVKEFDEFMEIPPCTKGWHSSEPIS